MRLIVRLLLLISIAIEVEVSGFQQIRTENEAKGGGNIKKKAKGVPPTGNRTIADIDAERDNGRFLVEQFSKSIDIIPSSLNRNGTFNPDTRFAIVTMIGETEVKGYNDYAMYQQLATMTLQSMMEYGSRWGYPVFFLNDFLMDKTRQAYWSKINIIRYYLENTGVDYLLYTDIDVLFTNFEQSLDRFVVDGYDVIGVNECVNRVKSHDSIRSGFMMFKNSPESVVFLDHWANLFPAYENIENPEQSALELLVTLPGFDSLVYLHDWKSFHSYDTCLGGESSFSMHFPGAYKTERIARMAAWLEMSEGQCFKKRSIIELLGVGPSVRDLSRSIIRNGLVSVNQLPFKAALATHELVDKFASFVRNAGCVISIHNSTAGLQKYIEYVWKYEETSFYWTIPKVIYFAVKDRSSIHPDLTKNLRKWHELNPDFVIFIQDDQDATDLVLTMFPILTNVWDQLEPIQRADIWRYVVIHSFGGWYFDVDVLPVRPIAAWDHDPFNTLVVGVEADNYAKGAPRHEGVRDLTFSQYAFGAAPQHPALSLVLEKVIALGAHLIMKPSMTVEERLLHVLNTTGPVVWTDSILEYFSVSALVTGRPLQTPDYFHLGCTHVNSKVFGIEGFGCGQYHSNSPSCDANGVNIWHRFGGSQYFRSGGQKWMDLPDHNAQDTSVSLIGNLRGN